MKKANEIRNLEVDQLEKELSRLQNMYVRRGIPVYFGEFGAVRRTSSADEPFRLYYFRYVCKAMRDRRIPALYWDNGNSKGGNDGFGVIDHHTGKYIGSGEQTVRAMVDSWEIGRAHV